MKEIICDKHKLIGLKVNFVLCLLLTLLFSCEKEKESDVYLYLQGNPETVHLPASSITETYTIYSNGAWKVEPSFDEDWISIDQLEGNGDGTITVVVQENNSPFERTLNLELSAVGMKHNRLLEITQAGEELIFNIEGHPTGLEIGTEGATQMYTIHSNGAWRIAQEGDGNWVSIDPTEGVNDGTFTITVSENTALDSREVSLVFYVYEQRQPLTFIINQEGTAGCIDIDGNIYETVVIGDREWMKENLRVTHYRNGDLIPTGLDNTAWRNTSSGAYAVSPYDPVDGVSSEGEMIATYGLLYNWYAANDSRGLCPTGWRVPTDADWKEMEMALGMTQAQADGPGWRGGPVGAKLKGVGGIWATHANVGTNESGFSVYPVAARLANGIYDTAANRIGGFALFWTSSEGSTSGGLRRGLASNNLGVDRSSQNQENGYCIRCVRSSN